MAITIVPSVVTGQTYSAANFNTHVRDNINGIWVLTTAGDMLYATGSSAAQRLALVTGGLMYGGASAPAWLTPSTRYHTLRMGDAYPEWGGYIGGKASRTTNQSVNPSVETDAIFTSADISQGVTWSSGDPTKLLVTITGLYAIFGAFSFDGGAGYRQGIIFKNNTTELLMQRVPTAEGEATYTPGLSDLFLLSAGDYLQLKVKHNYSNSAINLRSASMAAALIGV